MVVIFWARCDPINPTKLQTPNGKKIENNPCQMEQPTSHMTNWNGTPYRPYCTSHMTTVDDRICTFHVGIVVPHRKRRDII